MLTDQDILDLIKLPKAITSRTPARGYSDENGHRRCNVTLEGEGDQGGEFTVFIRQHERFVENFSIGLRYQTGDPALRTITLTRYNGPHGEFSISPDGHYALPHIHRITQAELESGSTEPQERHREITDRYSTYEEALAVFFADAAVQNHSDYFPALGQLRLPE